MTGRDLTVRPAFHQMDCFRPGNELAKATSSRAFSVPMESERGSIFCFDAFSSREPVSTSLENALVHPRVMAVVPPAVVMSAASAPAVMMATSAAVHMSVAVPMSSYLNHRVVLNGKRRD